MQQNRQASFFTRSVHQVITRARAQSEYRKQVFCRSSSPFCGAHFLQRIYVLERGNFLQRCAHFLQRKRLLLDSLLPLSGSPNVLRWSGLVLVVVLLCTLCCRWAKYFPWRSSLTLLGFPTFRRSSRCNRPVLQGRLKRAHAGVDRLPDEREVHGSRHPAQARPCHPRRRFRHVRQRNDKFTRQRETVSDDGWVYSSSVDVIRGVQTESFSLSCWVRSLSCWVRWQVSLI